MDSFVTNSVKTWEKVSTIFQKHELWRYVKPRRRTWIGRMAIPAEYDLYLGSSKVDHMAKFAEHRLRDASNFDEKFNWNVWEVSHGPQGAASCSTYFGRGWI